MESKKPNVEVLGDVEEFVKLLEDGVFEKEWCRQQESVRKFQKLHSSFLRNFHERLVHTEQMLDASED